MKLPPGVKAQPGMAGVIAGIKGGVSLRSTNAGEDAAPTALAGPDGFSSAPAAPRAPLAPLSALLYGASDSRKDVAYVASKKMKQLQWEKVSKAQLQKTVWSEPEVPEGEFAIKMQAANIWTEMEDEFKAKEVVFDAVKKRKETELLSVLASEHRKRIEILMSGSTAKSFKDPEKLSEAIKNFSPELCTETFLRELQGVLPSDDDVSASVGHANIAARKTPHAQRGHRRRAQALAPCRSSHGSSHSATSSYRPSTGYDVPGWLCPKH